MLSEDTERDRGIKWVNDIQNKRKLFFRQSQK